MGGMVIPRTDESVITEQDALRLTRDLLRIAIHTITYTRGLFPEKYFSVKDVPTLEMKVNMLMPMNAESRRLIDWMDKGIQDALQRKYLKTLLFCICKKDEGLMIEEYAFSFVYPNTNSEEVAMNITCAGFTEKISSAPEVTPDQISCAHEMVQTLISCLRSMNPVPEERTILMKLLYDDCSTPEDYEPPFFKRCSTNDSIWNNDTLKMDLGDFNSKHLVVTLKVKSILEPSCDKNANCGDDCAGVEIKSNQDAEFSVAEALYDSLSMNHVALPKHQEKLDGEMSQHTMQKLVHKIVPGGVMKNPANQISGHAVTQSESSNKKLLDINKIMLENNAEKVAIDTNTEQSKFECKDLLRVHRMRDISMIAAYSMEHDEMLTTQGKRRYRKASMGIHCALGLILGAGVNPRPTLYAWRLDSGASNHLAGANKWLTNRRNVPGPVPEFCNAANRNVNIDGMGDIIGPRLRLYNVYLTSDLEANEVYISLGQLTKEGYAVLVNREEQFTIHLAKDFNHIVGHGALNHESMAYLLEFFNGSILERGSVAEEIGEEYHAAKGNWVLDTGSPHHLTGDETGLEDCRDLDQPITVQMAGDADSVQCWKQGNVSVPNLELNNVCYHDRVHWNLVSVPKLNILGYNFYFSGDKCFIYREKDYLDGLAYRDQEEDIYYVKFLHLPKG